MDCYKHWREWHCRRRWGDGVCYANCLEVGKGVVAKWLTWFKLGTVLVEQPTMEMLALERVLSMSLTMCIGMFSMFSGVTKDFRPKSKYFYQKCFGPKKIPTNIFLAQKSFRPKFFWPKFFFRQHFFLSQIFFDQNFFSAKFYFCPNFFFGQKFFWSKSFFGQFFFRPNFFLTQLFF